MNGYSKHEYSTGWSWFISGERHGRLSHVSYSWRMFGLILVVGSVLTIEYRVGKEEVP